MAQPLARHPRRFEAPTSRSETEPKAGEGEGTASLSLDPRVAADSLRKSDGPHNTAPGFSTSHLPYVLRMMGKEPVDLFPANRITTRCSKCHEFIPRFDGYRHNKVGEKKVYCRNCQLQMGLPVRGGEEVASYAD
ncbi:MAG: hypothetical protein HY258_06120 [Chloroflexi bacterium]|nr:hypothetical protein [Chloroflexota bacterium]